MPRTCTICVHTGKETINQELVNGTAYRHIAARFDTSTGALQRHKNEHMPVTLAQAKEAEDVAQADDLMTQLVDLQSKAMSILGKAEEAGEMRTALMALKEARATMELVGKVTGELIHKRETDLTPNVQWTFVIGKGYVDREEWEAEKAWREEWRQAKGQTPRVVNGTVGELPPAVGAE